MNHRHRRSQCSAWPPVYSPRQSASAPALTRSFWILSPARRKCLRCTPQHTYLTTASIHHSPSPAATLLLSCPQTSGSLLPTLHPPSAPDQPPAGPAPCQYICERSWSVEQ